LLPSNERLILIKNTTNEGFTEGNNVAMRFILSKLDSKYILLLNNDTVVDRSFLDELVRVGESGQDVGFIGPKIYFYDFKG
jgi:GT2 family glycosyltransferase